MPSALADPQLPRELRRSSLTFFVIDQPGDDPELVPAYELDTKPLHDPFPMPLTDKTNFSATKSDSDALPLDKPPSSPRPSFRALPPTNHSEQARPISPEHSQSNARPTVGTTTSNSSRPPKASPESPQTPNSARELFPTLVNNLLPSSTTSSEELRNSHTPKDRASFSAIQASPLISKAQTAKQTSPHVSNSVPPITTTKSAIPPTFMPNASPSFTSPANTKPKHKSPLGSQPPIFAVDSSAKPPPSQRSSADLDKATHCLASIGLLEPHGILQQYIEHTATALIEDALRQFDREEPLRAARESCFIFTFLLPC